MTGARAERNEYLLLHEFHNKKYIVPDKQPFGSLSDKRVEDDGKLQRNDLIFIRGSSNNQKVFWKKKACVFRRSCFGT